MDSLVILNVTAKEHLFFGHLLTATCCRLWVVTSTATDINRCWGGHCIQLWSSVLNNKVLCFLETVQPPDYTVSQFRRPGCGLPPPKTWNPKCDSIRFFYCLATLSECAVYVMWTNVLILYTLIFKLRDRKCIEKLAASRLEGYEDEKFALFFAIESCFLAC
jgi:hypothetical protein